MIISKIFGGLGNQMFQYAMGRALAKRQGKEYKIDISAFEQYRLHRYSLPSLNITAPIATRDEILALKGKPVTGSVTGKFLQLFSKKNSHYVKEPSYLFSQKMHDLQADAYLEGYWQSEKYFNDAAELIRKEFTFKPEPDAMNKALLEHIKSVNAIAVHVRRGDYVSNANTNKFHGTTPIDYYQRAFDSMTKQVDNPYVFIFSDDALWVKENLHFSIPTQYVDHNSSDKNYEDLRLISACKHHIIANSSFSWWGAWLAEHPEQKVIAPLKWFNADQETRDLIPERWQRM